MAASRFEYSGFGNTAETWRKVRSAGSMQPIDISASATLIRPAIDLSNSSFIFIPKNSHKKGSSRQRVLNTVSNVKVSDVELFGWATTAITAPLPAVLS